jgi:hypothetical protein
MQTICKGSGTMRLLGKYFFSKKVDLIAFTTFIPVYLLYCIFFETSFVTLPPQPPYWFFILGWTLVDGSHVYSTLLVSYGDKDMFQQLKTLFLIVPIALLVSAFAFMYSGSPALFFYFLAYLAMVHFIRQEFGWMKIATRFDPAAPGWLMNLDKATAYAMTILPMMWFMRKTQSGFWYQKGDLLAIPDNIAEMAMTLYWPVVGVFLITNIYHSLKTKTVNLSKYLVFINTFFGWYMAKVHVQNTYLAVWLMIFHHGIPYYFIVFKTERVSNKIQWVNNLGKFKYPALYLSFAAIFFAFLMSHSGNSYVIQLAQNQTLKALVYAIAVTPQMTHFILDGFIWKKKYGLVGNVGR